MPTRAEILDALERAYEHTEQLVADLDREVVAGGDVRSTLNRLLRATWMFTLVNQHRPAGDDDRDLVGDDPQLAIAAAAKENLASWRQPGAFDGERRYPFGTVTARVAALMNIDIVVVHNRELAAVEHSVS